MGFRVTQRLAGWGLARWIVVACGLALGLWLSTALRAPADTAPLKTATYGWRPFVYEEIRTDGSRSTTGLDVRLTNKVLERSGYRVAYQGDTPWDTLLAQLKTGQIDLVISALKRPEREEYAYFSEVLRRSVNVLYLSRSTPLRTTAKSLDELLAFFEAQKFRLGVVQGYSYGDAILDQWLVDHTDQVVQAENDTALFTLVEQDQVDGFLIDQIVGADIAYREKFGDLVVEFPLTLSKLPYHVIFSKETVPYSMVEGFNKSLADLQASGEYNGIIKEYLFPLLLQFTTNQMWYFVIELVGVAAFTISGLLVAQRERVDLFGALVLAIIPGIGGGMLRDVIASRQPIGAIRYPTYMFVVLATLAVWVIALRVRHYLPGCAPISARNSRLLVDFLDTVGLSTLSIIGVLVALETQSTPLWLWGSLYATITSCAGGILQDMVLVRQETTTMRGSMYPIIALLGGAGLSIWIQYYSAQVNYFPGDIYRAVIITLVSTFIARLLTMKFKIKTPAFTE
jgi:polar amino acid transport system substrate-binding protein